jgi:hypothetical protein
MFTPLFAWAGHTPRPRPAAIRKLAAELGQPAGARIFIPKSQTVAVLFTLLTQPAGTWATFGEAGTRNAAIRLEESYPAWVEREHTATGVRYRLTAEGRAAAEGIKAVFVETDMGPPEGATTPPGAFALTLADARGRAVHAATLVCVTVSGATEAAEALALAAEMDSPILSLPGPGEAWSLYTTEAAAERIRAGR